MISRFLPISSEQVYWADMEAKDFSGKYDLSEEGLEKFATRAAKRAIKGAWALHNEPSNFQSHSYLYPELEAATGIKLCK